MNTREAKRLVKEHMNKHDLNHTYTKMTARTIDFTDLARDKMVFVKLHGWQPCPALLGIRQMAKEHGFKVETDHTF